MIAAKQNDETQSAPQEVLAPDMNRATKAMVEIRDGIEKRMGNFAEALPAHIPVERFKRVVITAIQNNTDLLSVNRLSLFTACMKAAQDGLLPDGRDGAIVPFKGLAQWMPMIGGIRKKVRNSGTLASWEVYVVYANDDFEYELGDNAFIRHKPTMGEKGPMIAAYSVAHLKDGTISREIMTRAEIDKVRTASRATKGPWVDWFEEMARKTVGRRHSKVLPMSTDMDDLIRRDDHMYDLDVSKDPARISRPKGLNAALDMLAGNHADDSAHDTHLTEISEAPGHEIDGVVENEEGAGSQAEPSPASAEQEGVVSAKTERRQPHDPEKLRKWFEGAAKGAQTIEELQEIWNDRIEPLEHFPPDKSDLESVRRRREHELEA